MNAVGSRLTPILGLAKARPLKSLSVAPGAGGWGAACLDSGYCPPDGSTAGRGASSALATGGRDPRARRFGSSSDRRARLVGEHAASAPGQAARCIAAGRRPAPPLLRAVGEPGVRGGEAVDHDAIHRAMDASRATAPASPQLSLPAHPDDYERGHGGALWRVSKTGSFSPPSLTPVASRGVCSSSRGAERVRVTMP